MVDLLVYLYLKKLVELLFLMRSIFSKVLLITMLLLSSRLINKTFENLYKIIKSSSKKMSSELRKTFARFNTTRFEKYVENLSNFINNSQSIQTLTNSVRSL